ncbi:MAG: M1 family metallopeptidase [Dehalococcoidia bacterium]
MTSPLPSQPDDHFYRLPRSVVPRRYTIQLTPDLAAATFAGEETIEVELRQSVQEIVLNSAEIVIESASLSNSAETLTGSITHDEEAERATLRFDHPAPAGDWQVHLHFRGILNDKLHGFYRSTFKDQAGREQVIASTQFESTDARRAFPCWDEPDFKATFAVTLIVDDGLMAVSNGAVVDEAPAGEGKKAVRFAETMVMSTYLVAFVVGPFEATEPVVVRGTPLRVVTPRGKLHLANYALGIGQFSLTYFADYFGIPYPADKLDLIAIPDFAFGAMENLGAVTFRETALLVDEKAASQPELERIADVVAHEIAHMWFGDLVTMRWWNGIWLNEAFATFMEMAAVDAWKPEWNRWDSFAIERSAAMAVDALESTRPVEYPVRLPAEASDMFDVLTYQKGGSVLRMLEQYLGPDAFREGIRNYLRKHSYGNTETTDLWDAIEESTGEPVREIMDSWILQKGFPLVTAARGSDGAVTLSQQIFRYGDRSGVDTLWKVPVLLRTDGAVETRRVLLDEGSKALEATTGERVVVNSGGSGFYRVRYEGGLFTAIAANIAALGPVERYQLVDNTVAAMVAGLASPQDVLSLATALTHEDDRNVWEAILGALGYLHRAADATLRPAVRTRIRELIKPKASALGWDPAADEDGLRRSLRGQLLQVLGTVGEDEETRREASDRYARYLEDRDSLDPNLVTPVVEILAYVGGPEQYQRFIARYQTAATPQEEVRYLMALAVFRDRTLAPRTLAMTLNGEIRTQNSAIVLSRLLGNLELSDMAWAFIQTRWTEILEKLPANMISRTVGSLAMVMDPAIATDARRFFQTAPLKEGRKQIEQTLERQGIAVAFKEREAATLRALFGG